MGIDCRRGVSPYPVGSSLNVIVDNGYADALGDPDALADCYLTPEEIATDPEAAALAASFIAETAASLGVDPSSIDVTGISLDNDQVPGCAPGFERGESRDPDVRGITIAMDDGFTGHLGNAMARADCMLTPTEIASDPQLARIARGFSGAACSIVGLMGTDLLSDTPRDCSASTGITVTGIQLVGCGQDNTSPQLTVQVPELFGNSLAGTEAYTDCTITDDELSPTGHDFINQVVQNEATLLGVAPSQITLDAIFMDGDSQEGCGQNAGVSGGFGVDLDPDYLNSLGDSTGGLDDGTLTPEEIAADADAQALADEFRAAVCASLGLVDCSQIDIDGIDVVGRRRQLAEGETPVMTAQPRWRFNNGDTLLRVQLKVV
eukprot:COSAG02_NODE_1387_length_12938_cov_24.292235_7_plen_377_part_00